MTYHFPVVVTQEKDGMYIGHVPMLPGCHSQAKTLGKLHKRMSEVITLCMEVDMNK